MTKYQYNDGGRREAGYRGIAGDCVVRAIAIAAQKPYAEVYNAIKHMSKNVAGSSPRTGVPKKIYHKYILSLGMRWTPLMFIGSGCKVHLDGDELPMGRIICRLSRHLTAVVDGEVNDIFDPSREGCRCVYGYYSFCSPVETELNTKI
jgi:hypothetical protein